MDRRHDAKDKVGAWLLFACVPRVRAQSPDVLLPVAITPAPAESTTMFEHPDGGRFWLSGQSNFITLAHGDFPAAYTGANSLLPRAEIKTSRLITVYTGFEMTPRREVVLRLEEAGGEGLSGPGGRWVPQPRRFHTDF